MKENLDSNTESTMQKAGYLLPLDIKFITPITSEMDIKFLQ
jgi:hypothetical protein